MRWVQVGRRLRLVLAIVLPALVAEPSPQRQDDRDQGGAAISLHQRRNASTCSSSVRYDSTSDCSSCLVNRQTLRAVSPQLFPGHALLPRMLTGHGALASA